MILVLLRHGIAQDRDDPSSPPDPERRLTPRGERRTLQAARGLRALFPEPRIVLSSPYVRARQTADLALEGLGARGVEVVPTDALLPEAPPADLLRVLERVGVDRVLAVGHAPNLDHVVAHSLGATAAATSLKKAGVACLELTPGAGPGRLAWLLEPRTLRLLARRL
ncbi:MAG: histidine phosphatase family protein [Planctomycetes bacterium]|nr:histidine phosphatase family protein [Planctomycetota bacterium]